MGLTRLPRSDSGTYYDTARIVLDHPVSIAGEGQRVHERHAVSGHPPSGRDPLLRDEGSRSTESNLVRRRGLEVVRVDLEEKFGARRDRGHARNRARQYILGEEARGDEPPRKRRIAAAGIE